MARVTVEDCILKVTNRFELVMLAAQRARNISAGAALTLERDNDKNPVVALREIADETVELKSLEEGLIRGLQKHIEMDEPEEDELDLLAIQQELEGEIGEAAPAEKIAEDLLKVEKETPPETGEGGEEAAPPDKAEGGEEAAPPDKAEGGEEAAPPDKAEGGEEAAPPDKAEGGEEAAPPDKADDGGTAAEASGIPETPETPETPEVSES